MTFAPSSDIYPTLNMPSSSRRTVYLLSLAELLGMSRFELMEHFERVGIPLRIGPETIEEAREEVRAALYGREDNSPVNSLSELVDDE